MRGPGNEAEWIGLQVDSAGNRQKKQAGLLVPPVAWLMDGVAVEMPDLEGPFRNRWNQAPC